MLTGVFGGFFRVVFTLFTTFSGFLRLNCLYLGLSLFVFMLYKRLIGTFYNWSTYCRVLVCSLRGNIWVLISTTWSCGVRLYFVG